MKSNLTDQFILRLKEVNGEFIHVESSAEMPKLFVQFLIDNGLTTLAISKGSFSTEDKLFISSQAEIIIDFDHDDLPSHKEAVNLVGQAEVGISRASALIANTGTVVLQSNYRGDRLCSTLPEVNVILWDGVTIYPTAAEYYADINPDLTYTLITGPSRTADIEKTLVLGAHGPRRLIVFGV